MRRQVDLRLSLTDISRRNSKATPLRKKAAKELHVNYPMLQIEVYDASTKVRTLVKE
jgi:hypothetical protein